MKEVSGKGVLALVFTFIFLIVTVGAEYTIQVSAFQEIEEALAMVQDLQSKGYAAYYVKSDLGSKGIWYRVRIGRFSDKAGAVSGGEKVKSREPLQYFITVYSTPSGTEYEPELNQIFNDSKEPVLITDPNTKTVPVNPSEPETVPSSVNDTDSLPVLPENTASYTVDSSTDTKESEVLFSLTEVMETKGSDDSKQEQFKLFKQDMEYADKIYVEARRNGKEVELRQAYEVYKKIASDYFFIKEVYKAKYKMALCLKDLGSYHDSIQILKNIVPELDPGEAALVQYEIGYIYYHHLRQYSKALDELEKVVLHYPDTAWAKEAKDLIHLIMTYKIYVVDEDYNENSND